MLFLTTQNISSDLLRNLADAKKLEERMDERLETAFELLLLYVFALGLFNSNRHQPLYELHEINQTEMTEYHKLMDQNIQRRQKATIPLDEPLKDLALPGDLLHLLDLPGDEEYAPTFNARRVTTGSSLASMSIPEEPLTPKITTSTPNETELMILEQSEGQTATSNPSSPKIKRREETITETTESTTTVTETPTPDKL